MKRMLFLWLLLPVWVFGQNIAVTGRQQIDRDESAYYCFPMFSPDGTKLYFTGANFRGIWQYELETGALVNINEYEGSGYQPQILDDRIVFRTQTYITGRKYTSLTLFEFESRQETVIADKKRHLNSISLLPDGTVVYSAEGQVNEARILPEFSKSGNALDQTYLLNDDAKLVIVQNGAARHLTPVGEGNYIWCSLSPDRTKIMFTVTGRGTYISDLEGAILSELGYANAPQWSPDGKWVVYMDDKDDGHTYISSDIYAASLDGVVRARLTGGDHIAMYPSWSPAGDRIAYHSDSGDIYLLNIQVIP